MSRRALLEAGARAGGAVAVAGTPAGRGVSHALAAPNRAAAAPKRGGTLVFALESNLDGFDPPEWATPTGGFTALAVFDTLIEPTYEGAMRPGLVGAMPTLSRGGTLFTFKLRPGVKARVRNYLV